MSVRVVVVTPPEPIVTLAEAKRHLRVEHADDDAYVTDLVAVATAWLDGPDGWLGRALGDQVLEAVFLPADRRCYPLPPFRSVESEAPQSGGRGTLVRWRAGYPVVDGRSTVPAPIRHAILLMVSHLFNNRDAVTTTQAQPSALPLGVDALLSPYRAWSV